MKSHFRMISLTIVAENTRQVKSRLCSSIFSTMDWKKKVLTSTREQVTLPAGTESRRRPWEAQPDPSNKSPGRVHNIRE
jgi:hypothetical protein